jgi:formyl-CoA transferase
VLEAPRVADVPSGRIYTAGDIAADPHYRARDMITNVTAASGIQVDMPGIVPKLSEHPGAIRHRAPTLGEHTDKILQDAGLDAQQLTNLRSKGIIA